MRVRTALESVPGVRKAEVDFNKKEAYVTADSSADTKAMLEAVDKLGYKASMKSASE